MTCAEFLELAEAHAIGALDGEERAAAEAHLLEAKEHRGCVEALDRARRGWNALAISLPPVRPHPRIWQGIEGRIAQPPARPRTRERLLWGTALAACLALLALAGWNLRQRDRLEDEQRTAVARQVEMLRRELGAQRLALALLQSPSSRVVPLAPQGGGGQRASAILDLESGRAVVVASALQAPPGREHELWLIRGGAKLPAGLLRAGADGNAVLAVDERLLRGGAPDAIAVTIEPSGGSPQPTGPIVLLGMVPKA